MKSGERKGNSTLAWVWNHLRPSLLFRRIIDSIWTEALQNFVHFGDAKSVQCSLNTVSKLFYHQKLAHRLFVCAFKPTTSK